MTSFVKVYEQAVASIDDPILTKVYNENPIAFYKKLYAFLLKAIPLFTIPVFVGDKLAKANPPVSTTESFTGNGINKVFSFNALQEDGGIVQEVFVNKRKRECRIDSELGEVTFNVAPENNSEIEIQQYYIGSFEEDLDSYTISILSLLLVSCWAEKEQNFLMDIRRLLHTTDFKLHSSATSLNSKVNWHYTMYEQAQKLMNSYSLRTQIKRGR